MRLRRLGGVASIRRPWTEGVASGLTPAKLGRILRAANEGDQDDYLTLAEEMEEREAHYRSVLQTRKLALSGLLPHVEAAGDDARAQAQAQALQVLVQAPNFRNLCFDLLDALGKGYSVAEINWQPGATQWQPTYAWRDPRWFCWERHTLSELRLRDNENIDGVPLPPYKFIIHTPQLKTGLLVRGGLARVAAWSYLWPTH